MDSTDGGGVTRLNLNPLRFNIFPSYQGDYAVLKDFFTRCIFEDERGRIWIGTHNNGLIIYDPKDGSLKNYKHRAGDPFSLPHNSVGAILRDQDENIWIGHGKGLSRFDEQNNRFSHVPIQLHANAGDTENNVYQLKQLSSGELMMATFYGLYSFRKDGKGLYYGTNWKNYSSTVAGIQELPNGDVWVASQLYGLFQVRPENSQVDYGPRFFNRLNLRSIHQDESEPQILWLCSGSGLIRFDTRTNDYKLYSEDHGIPGSFVYGMVEDDNHNYWLSTNSGLCFFDRENESFQNFTVRDGLQSNEFNTGAFHKGASGILYFGGIKGLNWFKTGAEQTNHNPPRSGIISIRANELPVHNDSAFQKTRSLSLAYHQNDLAFEFAVFDYSSPEANKVQYKLEGWDKDWVTTYSKTSRYSNLPPDSYVLKLRASNSGNYWGEEDTVTIIITAPFWRRRWFYISLAIFFLGGVIGITRIIAQRKLNRKLQELEKQHAVMQERERIRKDMHDDLGSGLSKIAILSELAKQNTPQDEFTKRQLDKISESSRQLVDNLGELIWSNNPANDNLPKFFWYLREHLGAMFEGTNVVLRITLPEFIPDVQVKAEWRRNIFLIVKESLHNVLKHAKASEVAVTIGVKMGSLFISIQDNGCGFDVEKKKDSGNGLSNMNNRIMECAGVLTISSIPGQGSKVTLEASFTHS